MTLLLAFILSVGIGVSLGLLGGGGSVLALPVLVYVAGVPAGEAVGMSLAIVAVTSALSAALHARSGNVAWRVVAIFAVAGAAGALIGARFTHLLPPRLLLGLYGLLLLAIGGAVLARVTSRAAAAGAGGRPRRIPSIAAAGLAVGLLTGFLGVGGGFVIVPALLLFARLEMRLAIGTSLAVIAANSTVGLIAHIGQARLDLGRTGAFAAFAVAGSLLGHTLAGRTRPERLQRGFAGLVLVVGGALAVRSLGLFH